MIPSGYTLSGSGDPVVLIHGSMNSKSQWRDLIDQLEKDYTVIAVDLSGYGQTPFPEEPDSHSLQAEADRVHQTISVLLGARTPVHLVAHSYGGAVALCYACRFPGEVQSLALFEPMANHLLIDFKETNILQEGRRVIDRISDLVTANEPNAAARAFVEFFSGEGVFAMLPEKAQTTLATYVLKMLVDYRTTIDTPLTMEDYRRIVCPFCLITGDASTEVSLTVSRILRDQIASIRWIEIHGNHMAPIAMPHTFNTVVNDWLDRVSRQSPQISALPEGQSCLT